MTKTNIKNNLKSLLSILLTISLVLILIISGQLIIHQDSNKQINSSTNTIKTNTYQVIKVYYSNSDNQYYLHTTNLLDAPYCFDIMLKDIQGNNTSDAMLEDLNKAFVGSQLSIKYDTKNTIDKYDDEIIEYKFIDSTTFKIDGKIKNSIVTIDNQYLNMIETDEGLYKVLSNNKLNNNQNVTLEINNDTGAVINLKEN